MALFGPFDVRIDPWEVDYGSELAVNPGEEPPEDIDLDVEVPASRWSPILLSAPVTPARLLFVDGVRRVEVRLLAWHGGRLCHGAFGSYGVGAVEVGAAGASWRDRRIGRVAVLGSGERLPETVDVAPALTYRPVSCKSAEIDGPMRAVQEEMRLAEERLARDLASADGNVVIADGPLTFSEPGRGAVVGYVKRLFRLYLERSQLEVLPALPVGSRTPLFALRSMARVARYSWFVRLAPLVGADSPFGGLARLEVSDRIGLDAARRLADATSASLPRLAPGRGRDPRAPQNLFPIGALESRLRRDLGDARLVRRRIQTIVFREGARTHA